MTATSLPDDTFERCKNWNVGFSARCVQYLIDQQTVRGNDRNMITISSLVLLL